MKFKKGDHLTKRGVSFGIPYIKFGTVEHTTKTKVVLQFA